MRVAGAQRIRRISCAHALRDLPLSHFVTTIYECHDEVRDLLDALSRASVRLANQQRRLAPVSTNQTVCPINSRGIACFKFDWAIPTILTSPFQSR